MARAWNTPIFILATLYFILDGVFSYLTRPVAEWIAKKRLFERARRWVISLPPYPSLALFAVPVIILEPAKPLAGYLIGTGHFFAGAVTFITAEVLKLTLVERLFQLNRDKLLSIPAFAWGYRYWRHMMDVIESLEVWRASRRLVANAASLVRTRWLQFKYAWFVLKYAWFVRNDRHEAGDAALALARIKRVAQAVADQVERQHHQKDRKPRPQRHPWRAGQETLR